MDERRDKICSPQEVIAYSFISLGYRFTLPSILNNRLNKDPDLVNDHIKVVPIPFHSL